MSMPAKYSPYLLKTAELQSYDKNIRAVNLTSSIVR